jgi:hypothetical protein
MGAYDLLDVTPGPCTIPYTVFAYIHQKMGFPVHCKGIHGWVPRQNGRVHEGVEVRCPVMMLSSTGNRRETRHSGLPTVRQDELDLVGAGPLFQHGEESGGTIQEGKICLDPVRADRHLTAIDAVRHTHWTGAIGLDTPAIFP